MVVRVTAGKDLTLSQPEILFSQHYNFGTGITFAQYDVSPDGQHFVMIKGTADSGRLNVVLHWFDELRAKAPAK